MMDKQTVASYIASIATATGGFLSLNDAALFLGIVFAALTYWVTRRTQRNKMKIDNEKRKEDAEFHKARMASITERECMAPTHPEQ